MSIQHFPVASLYLNTRETKLAQLRKQAVNYDQETDSLRPGLFVPTQECWRPLDDPINLFGTDDPTKRATKHMPGDRIPPNTPVFTTAELADEYTNIWFGDVK